MPLSNEFLRSLKSREYTGRWRLAEEKTGPLWKQRSVWVVQVEILSIYEHMITKEPWEEILTWKTAGTGELIMLGLGEKIAVAQTAKATIDH